MSALPPKADICGRRMSVNWAGRFAFAAGQMNHIGGVVAELEPII